MLEEWGWVGKVTDKRRMYVRRITLDRIGEESIIVLTNLLDEASARPSVGASLGSYHKPTAKTHKVAGGHSSAWKLLEQARKKKQSAERANK